MVCAGMISPQLMRLRPAPAACAGASAIYRREQHETLTASTPYKLCFDYDMHDGVGSTSHLWMPKMHIKGLEAVTCPSKHMRRLELRGEGDELPGADLENDKGGDEEAH